MSTRRGEAATLSRWDRLDSPLAPVSSFQREVLSELNGLMSSERNPGRGAPEEREFVPPGEVEGTLSETSCSESYPDAMFACVKELSEGRRSVESGHAFLEWVHHVEKSLQHTEDASYRRYLKRLDARIYEAHKLMDQVSACLGILKHLGEQYQFVETKSNSLHEACQHLIGEQNQLSTLSDNVSQVLAFYTEADKISMKLTSPTINVNSDQFIDILSKIDTCLRFINEHNDFKQNDIYKMKYQACLSRALNMIKTYFGNHLEKTCSAIALSNDNEENNEKAFTIFYGKFRALAPRVSHIMEQVESKTSKGYVSDKLETGGHLGPSPLWQHYESLLADCQSVYFSCRNRLLMPSIQSTVTYISSKHVRDHCGLMRAGYSFMLHICDDEYQLYYRFFNSDTPLLNEYLENLTQVLYDHFRPLVIHLQHLETLSEITGILRSEIKNGLKTYSHLQDSFHKVLSQLLHDVQERLVYRAYIYIQTDIAGYVPAKGDLAYPEKLEMMRSIAASINSGEEEEKRQRKLSTSSAVSSTSIEVANINLKSSPADLHGMWYPPLRRTLLCLSKLYRSLERGIFQGISQEALNACINSISEARTLISQTPNKSPIDGQLFEIKHLLILREQIAPFQVDFTVKELSLDFSTLTTKAMNILSNTKNFLEISYNNAILAFMLEGATPDVKETYVDSRKEVDKKLKAACVSFIYHITVLSVGPLKSFLDKCEDFKKNSNESTSVKLREQPWANPKDLQDKVSICQKQLKKHLPEIQKAMQLYLANSETEFILFRPIRNNIISTFMNFYQLTKNEFTQDEQIIIACPTEEQISIVISSLQLRPTSSANGVTTNSNAKISS
ncbi:conserved oligomeric Golgi complex subunit 3 isoform X2 [Lepeophtheirus salmonis]|uniref:conserved oligomeric Golgi complex subunit 3 isoform X2 n=1 Tax=Lepeophtheirus salmonis TaxID=72036 RepID=UPI001AEA60E9|nr:conserved oligomeric Golgi complex subunit 3-like isoform X2 [Lepeophtheirus salmonis]